MAVCINKYAKCLRYQLSASLIGDKLAINVANNYYYELV